MQPPIVWPPCEAVVPVEPLVLVELVALVEVWVLVEPLVRVELLVRVEPLEGVELLAGVGLVALEVELLEPQAASATAAKIVIRAARTWARKAHGDPSGVKRWTRTHFV